MSFDWPRLLSDHGIHYTDTGSNISQGYIAIERCPFCGKGGYKCAFGLEYGNVSCWACGRHSRLDTIMTLLHLTKDEALQVYHKCKGHISYTPLTSYSEPKATKIELPGKNFIPAAEKYMAFRGITPYHIETYDIRSGGITHPFFSYRIIFPVLVGGRIVSATGRSIVKDSTMRWLTLPASQEVMPHKHTLFGGDLAKGSSCCVVEGIVDAVLGGPGFVSPFGTSVTEQQIKLLAQYDRVFTAFDNDAPGIAAGKKISDILSVIGVEVVAISWDMGYKDIGEMSEDDRRYLRKELGL